MRWEPCLPGFGDMIRVRIGEIYHYGIFVSDGEVIQFGLPPDGNRHITDENVEVLSTDIDRFRNNGSPETAVLTVAERFKRFPPRKTVAIARNRLGEKGYHLLSNNCEHFVYECVFGTKYCSQTDDLRETIRNLPLVDVYVCAKDGIEELPGEDSHSFYTSSGFAARFAAYALQRSYGLRLEGLLKDQNGAYSLECQGVHVFVTACAKAVVCTVSKGGATVSVEGGNPFCTVTANAGEDRKDCMGSLSAERFKQFFPTVENPQTVFKTVTQDGAEVSFALTCGKGAFIRLYGVVDSNGTLSSKILK